MTMMMTADQAHCFGHSFWAALRLELFLLQELTIIESL
jgi:hypothetical protein